MQRTPHSLPYMRVRQQRDTSIVLNHPGVVAKPWREEVEGQSSRSVIDAICGEQSLFPARLDIYHSNNYFFRDFSPAAPTGRKRQWK
jgi:hypothetical protein